jgi:hypothetical protein
MQMHPLVEKQNGYTRSTMRVLKGKATFGDIVRLEIVGAKKRSSKKSKMSKKKELRKGKVGAREAVDAHYFKDSEHVRICKNIKIGGNHVANSKPPCESAALIAKPA